MKLIDYWPTLKHVNECIRPEAENPAEAVFLAVHRPMQFLHRAFHDVNNESIRSEQNLLDAFLEEDPPRGTLLLPILGDSGTGKSHMIRWLDVQLRRRKDSDTRHIIRIPKSSSLKRVLFLILESLHGRRYDRIRNQLQTARERLDEIQASESLRANLLTVIRRRVNTAKECILQARQRGTKPNPRETLWKEHGDERYLPALISDPVTSRLFMSRPGGSAGIVDVIAKHLANDADLNAPRRAQFAHDDFLVPEVLDTKEASEWAKRYLAKLGAHDGVFANQAVELLNEIIDEAIAPLTNPGDTGLTELLVEIREQLLADGRELVLLVEDFAALAGIQGALFDAMNREGVRDGRLVACVMRTALAVTRGYISRWETVSTRAVFGWELENVPHADDEQAVQAISDLVAAYLNAARLGQAKLEQLFKRRNQRSAEWSPRFDNQDELNEADRDSLLAFGASSSGLPLFPFNYAAIRQIALKRLRTPEGRIRFNPRDVINHIVRPVLTDYRGDFERKQFPPGQFLNFDINEVDAALRMKINDQYRNPGIRERFAATIRFWGDNVRDLPDVALPGAVYRSFGLEPLAIIGTPGRPKPVVLSGPTPPITPSQPEPIESAEIQKWVGIFDRWSQGTQMAHNDANQLRKWIYEGTIARIDWDRELLKPAEVSHELIVIPRAKGGKAQTADKAFVSVCEEKALDDASRLQDVVLELRAVVRFHYHKTWNFPESARDFAYYANFMERSAAQAVAYFARRYDQIDGNAIPAVTQALLFGARVLNTANSHAQTDGALVSAVFADSTETPTGDQSNWDKLRIACAQSRNAARVLLLRQVAARQGGAEKVHAVDAARLLDGIRPFKREWRGKTEFPAGPLANQQDESVRRHVSELRRDNVISWIKERSSELQAWRKNICGWLGPDFNKEQIVKTLLETLQEFQSLGLYPHDASVTRETLKTYIEAFRDTALQESLTQIERLAGDVEPGVVLSIAAQVDDRVRETCDNLVTHYDAFVQKARSNVKTQLQVAGANLVEETTRHIRSILNDLESLSDQLVGGKKR